MKIPVANCWIGGFLVLVAKNKTQWIKQQQETTDHITGIKHLILTNYSHIYTFPLLWNLIVTSCQLDFNWGPLANTNITLQKRPVTALLGKSYFHHGLKDCGKIPAPLPTCDRRPLLNRRSGDGNGWMVRLFSSKPPPLRQASPTEGFLQEISLHLICHRRIRIQYQYIDNIYHCIYAPDMPKA